MRWNGADVGVEEGRGRSSLERFEAETVFDDFVARPTVTADCDAISFTFSKMDFKSGAGATLPLLLPLLILLVPNHGWCLRASCKSRTTVESYAGQGRAGPCRASAAISDAVRLGQSAARGWC